MKVRALSLLIAGAVIISTLTGCGKSSSDKAANEKKDDSYQKIELVMAVNGTDIQIDARVADKFAELVEEETDGNVTIAVYPNDQLAGGNSTKGIEMIAGGGVDLAAYATCVMAVIDEQLSVATIPWIFEDYQDARETIDGTGGEYYAERLEKKGITYLGSFHNGFRQITNSKREVKTPEDVKRLKIRVPGSEVYMKFFKTLGADPVAMSWSEVFTAIQQGTIDGQENGICITESAKMDEVQDYLTLWNYTYENDLFVANTEIWESLEPKTRKMLQEKAREACEWGRDTLEAEEADIVKEFEAEGMNVTELTEEELDAFKESISGMKQEFIKRNRKEEVAMKIFDKIEEILAAVCLVVMAILTFANVIARYLFSASFSFSEEITTYLFVLLSMLGTAIAAKRRAHLGLSIVTDAVGPKAEKILRIIGYVAAVLFTGAIFYYGIRMVMNQRMLGQVTAGMQWPEWIFGSFVPIGAFFATVRFIQVLIEEIRRNPEKEERE